MKTGTKILSVFCQNSMISKEVSAIF